MRKHRLKQITFFDGFALGAFCASEIFLIVFMIIDTPLENEAWVGFVGNMVVAGFSIGAAYIALRGNRLQISQTNDIEDERREDSLIAARAVLPAVLSQICSVASNNLRLRFPPDTAPLGSDLVPATVFQRLPDDVIPPLKECIQHADGTSQERLANILRHFQVLTARSRSNQSIIEPTLGPTTTTLELQSAFSDAIGWATVYALAEDAFGFARGSKPSIPATLDPARVRSAFLLAGIMLENYPNLEAILNNRIANGRIETNWQDD